MSSLSIATAKEVFDLLRDDLAAVEQEFLKQSQSEVEVITDIAAYLMTGEARHDWEHSVPEQAATRWSIMFRNLSEKGRRRLANP